jgi:hypothetical protein
MASAYRNETVIDLSNAQLFLDDSIIGEANAVVRRWHQPRKVVDPVLRADRPWEHGGGPVMYGTVLHWRGKFRMWYALWSREPKPAVCYAESDDGVHWDKPSVGNAGTNVVLAGTAPGRFIDDIAIIDDPDDAEWPLKALYWEGIKHDRTKHDWGIWLARSKDGIQWDRSPGLVLPQWGDRFNALSVKVGGKYVLLGRAPVTSHHLRKVWRIESSDLKEWTAPQLVLQRDSEDPINMEYYSAMAFPYEGMLLGGLERMHMSPDRLDTELLWSRDLGVIWSRARTRPAFLAPSNEGRRWDDTWVNLPTNGPVRHKNRLWFYFSARSTAHNAPFPMIGGSIGLSILRIDGFASIAASEKSGWILTRPLTWPTDADLHVNVDPRRDLTAHPHFGGGEARVEVRDEGNKPIEGMTWQDCEPLAQTSELPDACAKVVWRTGKTMRDLAGRRVRLAFSLRDAHLYSFRAR